MLEQEFQYYKDHQAELVEKYNGKSLVIVGQQVVGVFDDDLTAYTEAKKTHKPGTFLIQKCGPGEKNFTETFHSRVAF